MRYRIALAAAVPAAVILGGLGTAHAVPTVGDAPANHGQCVSDSAKPAGKGGRSEVARAKGTCTVPLVCTENEDGEDTVVRDETNNTVTVTGSGPGSAGSSLACATDIEVVPGTVVSFTYTLDGTEGAPCTGGVPRVYVLIGTTYHNTHDANPDCRPDGTVSFSIPEGGTITEVGFVYDRGDTGSVTYRNTTIGGIALNI